MRDFRGGANIVVRGVCAAALAFFGSHASAQPIELDEARASVEVCVQSLTSTRQRIDALARQVQVCSADASGDASDSVQKERNMAIAALANAVKARIGVSPGCGEAVIDIRMEGNRLTVAARGTARDAAGAVQRIEEAIRDLGLAQGVIDLRATESCGRRLDDGVIVLTTDKGDQPLLKDRLSSREIERLPDVEVCEEMGQNLIRERIDPLRFWVRTPGGHLALCYRKGDGTFAWTDINIVGPGLVIQRRSTP